MRGNEGRRVPPHVAAAMAALVVAACASPVRSPIVARPVPAPAPAAASPTAAAPLTPPGLAPDQPPAAVSSPVPSPSPRPAVPLGASPPPSPPAPAIPPSAAAEIPADPPPASAAVMARFPEPAVSYATPAFETGRRAFTSNAELRAILSGLERRGGPGGAEVSVLEIGVSQAGEPLLALAFSRTGPLAPPAPPAPASASGSAPAAASPPMPSRRPAVLIVAGQHGDEPAGTEALLVVAQELASGRLERLLERVDVVLLPRANPDGAARFQRGTADGTDLNRDHLILQTPEAQAMARLLLDVAPVVVLDLHEYAVGGAFVEKFGALPRFDVLLQTATVANLPAFIAKAAEEWFRQPLVAGLRNAGLSADWYATTTADPADRKLSMGGVGPQLFRNAAGLRNAVGVLVESRGGGMGRVDLKRRVQAQVVSVHTVLGQAAGRAADLVKLRQFVERETAALACQGEAVLEAAPTPSEYALSVLDGDTGAIRRLNVNWDSALALRVVRSRPRPCGYWLAAGQTEAVRRLHLLGIEVQQLDEAGEVRGESYREIAREPVGGEGEGSGAAHAGGPIRVRVQTVPALLELPADGYYVSLEQPLANLAIAVLEPESPASFAAHRLIDNPAALARVLQRPTLRLSAVPVR
jgi:hypothetical protein